MNLSASDLPDDVDALKAMIVTMSAEGAAARAEIARLEALKNDTDERIANLTAIVNVLQRAQNGTRLERLRLGLNVDQINFAFEKSRPAWAQLSVSLTKPGKTSQSGRLVRAKVLPPTLSGSRRSSSQKFRKTVRAWKRF